MPLSIQCWNIVFHDGTVASNAFWCEHIEIVVAAVGFTITLQIISNNVKTLEKYYRLFFLYQKSNLLHGSHLRRIAVHIVHRRNVLCAMSCLELWHISKYEIKIQLFNRNHKWNSSWYTYVQNSAVAVSTTRAEQIVIVWF